MLQYIAVTTDRYEFPIACADSPRELAEVLGITRNAVSSAICKMINGRFKGYKIIVVDIGYYHDPLGDIPYRQGWSRRKRVNVCKEDSVG